MTPRSSTSCRVDGLGVRRQVLYRRQIRGRGRDHHILRRIRERQEGRLPRAALRSAVRGTLTKQRVHQDPRETLSGISYFFP